jgi:SAM-dependent methyltransferase
MEWRIGEDLGDGRWRAPAAERNRDPILAVLAPRLPAHGLVLEIGSGTGQHVVHFARALRTVTWQPSERDPHLRRSIDAWRAAEALPNVRPPLALDIEAPAWPIDAADAVVCINVVHVSPWSTVPALLAGCARVLPPHGPVFLYGPYMRGGRHTAESNAQFDGQLRAHDPRWGVRDTEAMAAAAQRAGLHLAEIVAMPANNLTLILVRDADPPPPAAG